MPGTRIDGFLAHEVSAVVPEEVHGAKEAVDEAGAPVFRQIDRAKLVPLLAAAVRELVAEIAALNSSTARVTMGAKAK